MPTEIVVLLLVIVAAIVGLAIWVFKKRRAAPSTGKEPLTVVAHTQNNELVIAEIESLILKDNDGLELTLTRPNTAQMSEKRYREVCVRGSAVLGNVVQGAMPVLAQAQTLNEIAKMAPNGLFTATAPVQDLMKLSGGTVGSAVMKDGKIAAQAGFAEVVASAANPVAVVAGAMQAMALISGQYYMNEISKQLENVDRKLDKLIGYHHDEKIGVLRSVNRELLELAAKTYVDAADIISCQRLEEKCGEVYFEYLTRLEGATIGAKERWFNKSKELKELGASIDESELDFSIQMCYQASMLLEKCKLTEIAIRLKVGGGQERFIAEQAQILRKFSDEAFHRNVHLHINTHYTPVLEKANAIAAAKKIPLLFDTSQEKSSIQSRKDKVIAMLADSDSEDNLAEKMLCSLCEPQETLVLLGDTPETQRVFVLDEEMKINEMREE